MAQQILDVAKSSLKDAYNKAAQAEKEAWRRKDNARYAALCRWGKAEEERSYAVSIEEGGTTHHGAGGQFRERRDAQRAARRLDDPNNTARRVFVQRWTVYK